MPINETTAIIVGAAAILVAAVFLILRELIAPRRNKKKRRANKAREYQAAAAPTPVALDVPVDFAEAHDIEQDITQVGKKGLPSTVSSSSAEDSGSFSKSAEMTVYAPDAEPNEDEWTGPVQRILASAVGQSDVGKKRKKNEDSYVVLEQFGLFVVADGVGGHAGGEVASALATETIQRAFLTGALDGNPDPVRPKRANELVWAVQAANSAIHGRASTDRALAGMATTVLCARFTPRKRRVYIAHVGDSPGYRVRDGKLVRLTVDHTLARAGVPGPMGTQLSRALGVSADVAVDVVIDAPRSGDQYLLCSDGLSKMVSEEQIQRVLVAGRNPKESVAELIRLANEHGGVDNVTAIVVMVDEPSAAPPL